MLFSQLIGVCRLSAVYRVSVACRQSDVEVLILPSVQEMQRSIPGFTTNLIFLLMPQTHPRMLKFSWNTQPPTRSLRVPHFSPNKIEMLVQIHHDVSYFA